ncbi:hypothetical protein [Haloferula sp. A504]|uniref:hypothetical protein n=1 Tax=Haloferula sp. A504 TaxID=3373601 RepID=UPI0031C24B01|nr:hypothetical protein [Verrucomicrobiaceae bacterium E54]
MSKASRSKGFVGLLLLLACVSTSQGVLVSYSFTGTFTSDFGTISAGAVVTGGFSYQVPQTGTVSYPTWAHYVYETAWFRVETAEFSSVADLIVIRNGTYGRDDFQLLLDPDIVLGGISLADYTPLQIVLHDYDESIFSSTELPMVLPNLSEFEDPRIGATSTAQSQSTENLWIAITELNAVPEASSALLATFSVVICVFARRRE